MNDRITKRELHYLHLGGWCVVAEMIRKKTMPLEGIARVARLWADSWHGDQWPIVKKCREGFKNEPELLGPFLEVLSLAGLTHLATAYINSRPDFMNQSVKTESQHRSERIKQGIQAARKRRKAAAESTEDIDAAGAGSDSE